MEFWLPIYELRKNRMGGEGEGHPLSLPVSEIYLLRQSVPHLRPWDWPVPVLLKLWNYVHISMLLL